MAARMNVNEYMKIAQPAVKGMIDVEKALVESPLDPMLLHLVKVRASQINGCAFCIHMHTREALQDGEAPERLYLLAGWRESSYYSDRERAALAWTESLTNVASTHAPDDDWNLVQETFTSEEQVWLTFAIAAINFWNRTQVAFRASHPSALT